MRESADYLSMVSYKQCDQVALSGLSTRELYLASLLENYSRHDILVAVEFLTKRVSSPDIDDNLRKSLKRVMRNLLRDTKDLALTLGVEGNLGKYAVLQKHKKHSLAAFEVSTKALGARRD
jgi:hypothetical protein